VAIGKVTFDFAAGQAQFFQIQYFEFARPKSLSTEGKVSNTTIY
jgi:hypothetical protein